MLDSMETDRINVEKPISLMISDMYELPLKNMYSHDVDLAYLWRKEVRRTKMNPGYALS
jgi:hypothetical protein